MSPKLPRGLRGTDIVRALKRAGWQEHHRRGSHVYLRHPEKLGAQVTVPIHRGQDILPKTLASILEAAGLSVEEFSELLSGENL